MPRRHVLLLTHSGDALVPERVAAAIARHGGEPVRVDTDRFPAEIRASTRITTGTDASARTDRLVLPDGRVIDGADVAGVWLRRPMPPALPEVPDSLREQAQLESAAALSALLSLPAAAIIDRPSAIAVFEGRKPYQLTLAAALGLRVPRTLVTNDPDEALRFVGDDDPGRYVCKMLTAPADPVHTVYTRTLARADLDDLDGLRACPMVFQERIVKARELRVVMVDGESHAGAVIAPELDDWRRPGRDAFVRNAAGSVWHPAALPAPVAATAASMLAHAGLRSGVFDFIETPEGEHVFLEINPTGEWGMLAVELELPIADALARALLSPERA